MLTAVDQGAVRDWAGELDALHARVAARFGRAEPRRGIAHRRGRSDGTVDRRTDVPSRVGVRVAVADRRGAPPRLVPRRRVADPPPTARVTALTRTSTCLDETGRRRSNR